ncbi:MAG: hypothetical protein QOC75_1736, partial [Pseudonocardiales bacterium]|nr:hypothetical protein [Pseudonocardiales bacterium]
TPATATCGERERSDGQQCHGTNSHFTNPALM